MFLSLLSLSSYSFSSSLSLSHHTQKIIDQSSLSKHDKHDSKILYKLEEESKRFDHRSTNSQVLFTDILQEISTLKHVHGQVLSPNAVEEFLTKFSIEKTNLRADSSSSSSRSLMKKNNFIELSVYGDLMCMNKVRSVGRLVNYCYNQYGGSYLFKVNRKVSGE
jgi:hypothetical protein